MEVDKKELSRNLKIILKDYVLTDEGKKNLKDLMKKWT